MSKVSKTRTALIATLAACAIAVVGLVGCGGDANEAKSAAEVYEHYSQVAHDNFEMDGTIEMNVSAAGMSMEIPMNMHIEAADKAMHSTMSTEMFGSKSESESYIIPEGNNYVVYSSEEGLTSTGQEKTWTKTTSTDAMEGFDQLTALEKSMFDDAEFAKTTDGYTVTVPLTKMMSALQNASEDAENEFSQMMDSMTSMGVSLDNIKVTYNFDKDYNLTKILIPKTDIPFDIEGQSGSMSIACEMTLSNFGKVAPITVPDDIAKNAKESSSLSDSTANLLEESSAAESAGSAAADGASSAASDTASNAASSAGSAIGEAASSAAAAGVDVAANTSDSSASAEK